MGRFHRHADGTVHEHDHDDGAHHHGDVGDHSGYTETGVSRVAVLEDILSENDRVADANRHDMAHAGVRSVNLMSSPGAGKTTLAGAFARTSSPIGCASASSKATSRRASTRIGSTGSAPRLRSSTRVPASEASAISTP